MIPELYERLRIDPCKPWPEAIAQSYFQADIESRATFAFYEYCKNLRTGDGCPELLHMILQFDGSDVSIRPFPDNFRSIDERWVEQSTGFRANLVEKRRNFSEEYVTMEEIEVEKNGASPYDSILGKSGNCIFLAMYRLSGSPELAQVWEGVIRG